MPQTVEATPYRDSLLKALANPVSAAHYLNASLEDGDSRVFLMALRDVADANGGMSLLAESSKLNRESLYRALSESGNPSLSSLAAVLKSLGLRLAVQSNAPKNPKRRAA